MCGGGGAVVAALLAGRGQGAAEVKIEGRRGVWVAAARTYLHRGKLHAKSARATELGVQTQAEQSILCTLLGLRVEVPPNKP